MCCVCVCVGVCVVCVCVCVCVCECVCVCVCVGVILTEAGTVSAHLGEKQTHVEVRKLLSLWFRCACEKFSIQMTNINILM